MRNPSGRVRRNSGSITPVRFPDDADGRRQMIPMPAGPSSRCRVHPTSAEDLPAQMREQGVEYYTVHLFEDPGDVREHDLFNWLDYTPPRVCNVIGTPRPSSGEFATWLMDVEYRRPPTPRT